LQPPAPGCKPQAKLNPYYISKKPADPGWHRMSPAPKRGEWGAGDVGAPTGAVPINPSSYSHELYWVKLLEWFVEENLGEPIMTRTLRKAQGSR